MGARVLKAAGVVATMVLLSTASAQAGRKPKPRVGTIAANGVRWLGRTVDKVSDKLVAAGQRQAERGHARRAKVLEGGGRGLKTALGSETLLNTSCSLWVSSGVDIPVPLLAGRLGGSLAVYTGKPKNDYSDRLAWAVGGAAAGPVQQLYSTYEGHITSVSPVMIGPVRITASSSDVKDAITAAIPFGPSGTAGLDKGRKRLQPDGTEVREEGRGPFVGGAIGLGPVAIGGCIYSPLLQPIAEKVAVPAAMLGRVQDKLLGVLSQGAQGVKKLGQRALERVRSRRGGAR